VRQTLNVYVVYIHPTTSLVFMEKNHE